MNARYYDPQIGQFISPDTLVPDATNLMDFNRYMYARGNPMKYNDPSGHVSSAIHDSDGGTIPAWLKQLGDHWADLYANDPTKLGPEIRLYLEGLKGGFTEFQSTGKLLEIYYGQTNGGIIAEYQNTFANAWSGGDLQTAWHLTGGWGANADAALLAGSVVAAVGSGHESVAPANDPLFKPGLHANPEGSIPASGPRVTRKERALIQDLGNQHGCHSCGATEPGGTGVWIGDHQPPTSIANGEPQRLYPQCQACSNRQGGLLSWLSR